MIKVFSENNYHKNVIASFHIVQVFICISLIFFVAFSTRAQTWSPIGFYSYGGTSKLAIDTTTGILYAGGSFPATGTVTPGIARRIGTTWDSLGSGMNGSVNALFMFNGSLYAGGNFTSAGGVAANYIARWDGSGWHPLGTGMDGIVFALTVHNNELYAAGLFTTAGGTPTSHIAKWDGNNWSALGAGCDGVVYALISFNGDLYAGGSFANAGGTAVNDIAKWDGSNWSSLGSGTNTGNSGVRCFAVHDGSLYMGGYFTHAGGIAAANIAKWNGSGFESLDSGLDGTVYVMESYNCELYVGGNFTTAGGLSSPELAKYNPNGGWSPVSLPMPLSGIGSFDALISYSGDLYIGGYVGSPNGNVQLCNNPVPAFPAAAFTSTQTITQLGNYIQFFSTGGDAVNFKWSFPGGLPSTSSEKNPKIYYPSVGDFDVSLIASNCQGSDTLSYTSFIHIDSLIHAMPIGNSSDFITMSSPPNTTYYYGDYHVYYYKPATYDSLTSPILFYIHGQGGTGAGNADLRDMADRQNAMIVSPTMRPSYGYVRDIAYDSITGCQHRIFMTDVMKQIYRHVLYREQRPVIDAYLTGFSEGGQFTTRYMLIRQFSPDSIPIKMAVSVSPANYTLMTDTFNNAVMLWIAYRCGLAGHETFVACQSTQQNIPVSDFICNEHIIQYYNENYGILIGTADTQPFASFCGYATGTDRYDRAKVFHTFSTSDAIARGTTLQWVFDSVQFIGHSNYWMYNSKVNATDTFTIAENMLFNTPYHVVPQLTPSCIPTGIGEDTASPGTVFIYPNPGTGIFTIDCKGVYEHAVLQIYNAMGQMIFSRELSRNPDIIDISAHADGMYFYRLEGKNGRVKAGKIMMN